MNGADFIVLLLLMIIIWYWQDGMRAKELARGCGRSACMDAGVTFLDDTVALKKINLRRNQQGQMAIFRQYHFEFSSDGAWRYSGCIDLLGRQILSVDMEAHREI